MSQSVPFGRDVPTQKKLDSFFIWSPLVLQHIGGTAVRGRLHELKKGLFSALKLSGLLHTGPKLELKKSTLLAHVNAP